MEKFTKFIIITLLLVSLLAIFLPTDIQLSSRSAYGHQPNQYFMPLFFSPQHPLTSTSYYMTTLNYGFLHELGCELGRRDQNQHEHRDSVAVLAFGYPRCFKEGGYGANLFGFGPASLEHIRTAIIHFAAGYYLCTGADMESNLIIGVGTSNYLGGTEPCETETKAKAHGAAWSGMVSEINQWLADYGIFHQVQAFGANDMELDWNSPEWTRAWIAGFEQVSGNFLLHFGDAAGCPYEDKPSWGCGTSKYPEWTIEDVWYISYGAPSALPLPLIYLTNGVHAKQWAYLSQYSFDQHGYRMAFAGVFTQWAACQQFGNCFGIDNTPEEAYQQLSFELGKSPATAQKLNWKTDIRWILQDEITTADTRSAYLKDGSTPHPLEKSSAAFESALQEYYLSPTLESSLEIKQNTYQTMAQLAAISKANYAPKDAPLSLPVTRTADLTFQSGFFPKGEIPGRPYGIEITTVWQAEVENGYLQIAGGSSPADPQQGALYIVFTATDHQSFQSEMILAPEGCGPLTILAEDDRLLFLKSSEGCQFTFNLQDWVLTASSN